MRRPLNPSVSPSGGIRYKQPETPFSVHSLSLKDIKKRVRSHRLSVPFLHLDTADGWEDRLLNDLCEQNPKYPCEEVPFPPESHPLAVEGRARWKELHDYAESYPDSPSGDEIAWAEAWLASWRNRIPDYRNCKCRETFAEFEKKHPFDLSSRRSFWRSSVALHDLVNAKLGKPTFSDMLLAKFG